MIIRLNAAIRHQLDHRERGAATLEAVGMYVVAALLAVGLLVVATGAGPVVGDKFRQAVCVLTTLGQGQCNSSVDSADPHKPTEPCVVSAEGHTGSVEGGVVVSVGGSEKFLVETLNNGKFRVTRAMGGKVAATAGAGVNATVTWNDKTVGAAAAWDAGAAAKVSGGEVYYTDSLKGVENLVSAHREDVAKDLVLSAPGTRWLVDKAEHLVGVGHDFPPPDETYVEGSVGVDADAQLTAGTANAQVGAGAEAALGTRLGRDGTSTTYYKGSVKANISAGSWVSDEKTGETAYAKVGVEGKAEGIYEVERDAKGIITTVRYKSVTSYKAEAAEKGATVNKGPGEKKGYTESVVELPIRTATDQVIAQRYLNAGGVGPMGSGFKDLPKGGDLQMPSTDDSLSPSKAFAQAAGDHGVVTEQTFDDGNSGTYAANADVEAVAEVGLNVTVDKVGRKSTGLNWFDGKRMVPEKGCVAK